MSSWGLAICSLVYLYVSWEHFQKKDSPHALMYFSYSVANLALLWHYLKEVAGKTP